jgi:hypothetical protein
MGDEVVDQDPSVRARGWVAADSVVAVAAVDVAGNVLALHGQNMVLDLVASHASVDGGVFVVGYPGHPTVGGTC